MNKLDDWKLYMKYYFETIVVHIATEDVEKKQNFEVDSMDSIASAIHCSR